MSVWPAEQWPELYPPGTARLEYEKIKRVLAETQALFAANPGLTVPQKRALLKSHGYTVSDGDKDRVVIFLASAIAPELDHYLDLTD